MTSDPDAQSRLTAAALAAAMLAGVLALTHHALNTLGGHGPLIAAAL